MTDMIPRDAAIAAIRDWWKDRIASGFPNDPVAVVQAIPTIDPAAIREEKA